MTSSWCFGSGFVALLAFPALAAACNAFSSSAVDPPADASPGDAGPADAPPAADAADAADAPPCSFGAPRVDDFERDALAGGPLDWSVPTLKTDVAFELTSDQSASPMQSLRVVVAKPNDNKDKRQTASTRFPPTGCVRLTLSLMLKGNVESTVNFFELAGPAGAPLVERMAVIGQLSNGTRLRLYTQDGNKGFIQFGAVKLSTTAWTRLELTFDGRRGRVHASLPAADALPDADGDAGTASFTTARTFDAFAIGSTYADPSAAATVYVDDVSLAFSP